MLERVAEHLSWRANQCNLAARAAKDAGNDATDRLRTLQAREFFRGAARLAEGKQAGIHLISANNMTRRLDVTLAIIEYQRLLAAPDMAELRRHEPPRLPPQAQAPGAALPGTAVRRRGVRARRVPRAGRCCSTR